MSLSWNIADIKDNEKFKVYEEDGERWRLHHRTEGLIYHCISVGIGTITADNAAEFYARSRIVEGARGSMCYGPDPVIELMEKIKAIMPMLLAEDVEKILREAGVGSMKEGGRDMPFTIEEIQAHIGLSTNVTYETREEWAMRMIVGKYGDGLTKDGRRKLTVEEREKVQEKLEEKADALYEEGRYQEADALRNRLDRYWTSLSDDLVQAYNAFATKETTA